MGQVYRERKEKFDAVAYGYIVKRLTEPYESTDAYGVGHIDERGNEIDDSEDWSYTKLDKLVLDIRAALGDALTKVVPGSFAGSDALGLMDAPATTKEFLAKYAGIVNLVEETAYLPDEHRGQGGTPQETVDSGMTPEQRVSFALTVATTLLCSLIKDRLVTESEFTDEVLNTVEATFGVRSIGSAREILGFIRSSGLSNGRDVTNEGIRLLSRISKEVVSKNLVDPKRPGGMNNQGESWVEVSRA